MRLFDWKNIIISFLLMSSVSLAETCPTVQAIQQDALAGWKIYDSDDNHPLALAQQKQFQQAVARFVFATWENNNKQSGKIACYYNNKQGSQLSAYLAKTNTLLYANQTYWYPVSRALHCAASEAFCQFNSIFKNHLKKRYV